MRWAIAGEAIATLSRRTRRSAITEEALRVLQLRVEHPEYSLRELAAAHTPPLTKDSYAARLRRALRAADGQFVQVRQHRPHQRCLIHPYGCIVLTSRTSALVERR